MEVRDSDRLRARLYAIDMRVAELDHQMQQTQVHVQRLEAQLEDARLAQIVGEEAGDPAEIRPELERSRGALESQREFLDLVKKNQWKARVAHALETMKERQAAKKADG